MGQRWQGHDMRLFAKFFAMRVFVTRRLARRSLGTLILCPAVCLAMLFGQSPVIATAPGATQEAAQSKKQDFVIKAAVPNHPKVVIKNGSHFLLMEEDGLMPAGTDFGYGLYRDDTRYLSQWDVDLSGVGLAALSANTDAGYSGRFLYSNQSYSPAPQKTVPGETLFIQRDVVVNGNVYERLTITNFSPNTAEGVLGIKYDADYADMFEVRGMGRKARGSLLPAEIAGSKQAVTLSYRGLDHQVMKTKINFMRQTPISISDHEAKFKFVLPPNAVYIVEAIISTNFNEPDFDPSGDEQVAEPLKKFAYERQQQLADDDYQSWRKQGVSITTDNQIFNSLLERSYRDLYILRQKTPRGECVAAGVPWFAVAFGRDQDVVGRETVALMPDLARSILHVLAQYQGTKEDAVTEEKPGKIMHELRIGEMARCKEIPFRPYYGSVDCTPLWLSLMASYVDWTGDTKFVRDHWDNVLAALELLDREAKSGYLTYGGDRANAALSNQGWKDSGDSVMMSNGKLAIPPIALSEVQGYLYAAWRSAARLASITGHSDLADKLKQKADDLKVRFNKDFYFPRQQFIYEALAGEGKPCDVVSSNPGHLLSTGILQDDYAAQVCDKLMKPEMFCGWGVRTLSAFEAAYNPISYHDGSVWPHDNAMIVEGLCRSGHQGDGMRVMDAMFLAAQARRNLRLPELFCGFSKNFSSTPIWYPVSCEPQAWAAGSMFLMLTSGLGLQADAVQHELRICKPCLPPFLSSVKMNNVHVGADTAALEFTRSGEKTTCNVASKSDGLRVSIDQ
jgi:glycogen debranching enzyme